MTRPSLRRLPPFVRAFSLGLVALGLASLAPAACSSSTSTIDPCPGDATHTVGDYCDQIVPPLCRYAVDACGMGDYDTCVLQSNATCWQGNRSRLTCSADAGAIADCVYKYAGADAAFDGAPPPGTSGGLSCDAVRAGFAPRECQSIVQRKFAPPGGR